MAWSKARAMRQTLTGLQVAPNCGRVPERVYGGSEAGMVNVKGVGWRSGMARFIGVDVAVGCEPAGDG